MFDLTGKFFEIHINTWQTPPDGELGITVFNDAIGEFDATFTAGPLSQPATVRLQEDGSFELRTQIGKTILRYMEGVLGQLPQPQALLFMTGHTRTFYTGHPLVYAPHAPTALSTFSGLESVQVS